MGRKINIGIKRDVRDMFINYNVYILFEFSFEQKNENIYTSFY